MSVGKKTKLRRQNIIDLINSRPYGTPIRLREFAAVAQLSESSAWSLINTMVDKGVISRDQISRYKSAYRVNGLVTTRKIDKPTPLEPTTTISAPADTPVPPPATIT